MEKKITTINNFYDVARNNDYFLWHFLQKNQEKGMLSLFSYSETREEVDNKMKEIIDMVGIPYFESYTEDSMDFLHDVGGYDYNRLWNRKAPTHDVSFNPVVIGFKRLNKVSDTLTKCYCVDGVLEIISELNPEFLLSVNTED